MGDQYLSFSGQGGENMRTRSRSGEKRSCWSVSLFLDASIRPYSLETMAEMLTFELSQVYLSNTKLLCFLHKFKVNLLRCPQICGNPVGLEEMHVNECMSGCAII